MANSDQEAVDCSQQGGRLRVPVDEADVAVMPKAIGDVAARLDLERCGLAFPQSYETALPPSNLRTPDSQPLTPSTKSSTGVLSP